MLEIHIQLHMAILAGETWTFSVWAKANQNCSGEIFLFESNSSGGYGSFTQPTINITTEWQRFTATRTLTDGATVGIQVRVDGPNSYGGTPITIWWDGIQVEKSSSVSTFSSKYTKQESPGLISSKTP